MLTLPNMDNMLSMFGRVFPFHLPPPSNPIRIPPPHIATGIAKTKYPSNNLGYSGYCVK